MTYLRALKSGTAAAALALTLGACATDRTVGNVRTGVTESGDSEAKSAAIMRIAASTLAAGDAATAAGLYRRAHDLQPSALAPLLGLGRAFAMLGANDEAVVAYRAALAIDPNDIEALRGMGGALLALDQPRQAITHLEVVLDRAGDARTHNALGLAHDMLGEHKSAQACYRTGLNTEPGNFALRNNLGLSLVLSGDFREGIAILRQVAEMPGANARQRLNLALAYGLAGETEQAMQVARMDLDEQAVRSNVAFYRMLRSMDDPKAVMKAIGAYHAGGGQVDLAQMQKR